MQPADLDLVLDLTGVAVFALAGALAGVRKRLDVVGVLVVGTVSAIGGGMLRDVLLGATPPAALQDWRYLAVPAVASGVTFVVHPALSRLRRTVRLLDAAGLALFVVSGTALALGAGLPTPAACLLGVLTGVGGGVIRDVLLNEIPLVLADGQFYAVAGLVGAVVVAISWHTDAYGPVTAAIAVAVAFTVRMVTFHLGWTMPTPRMAPE